MKRILKYITEKKIKKLDIFAVVILAIILFFLDSNWYKADGIFQAQIAMTDAYMASSDTQGNTYIVDAGHTRVLKLNQDKNVVFSLRENSKKAGTISYVSDLAVGNNGDVFVEENHWGGLYVDREAIFVYDARGNYKTTCYEVIYDDEYVDKRKIFGMVTDEEWLYFAVLERDSIQICQIDQITYEFSVVRELDYENAFNAVYDVCIIPESMDVYVLDKCNQVMHISGDEVRVLYASEQDSTYKGQVAFYTMAVDPERNIYLADIKGNRIFYMTQGSSVPEVLVEGLDALSVDIQPQSNGQVILTAVYGGQLYQTDISGNRLLYEGASFSRDAGMEILIILLYAGMTGVFLTGVWVIMRVVVFLTSLKVSSVIRNGILISAIVVVVVTIVVSQLMGSFRSVYTNELFEKLYIFAYSVSAQIDVDAVESVNDPEDFMSRDYNNLIADLNRILDREYEFNQSIYCNILKYEDGKGYSVAYLDQSTGTYYPLNDLETEEVARIYETGEAIQNGGMEDVAGIFAYVKVPVLADDGSVIAVVAVGSDTTIIRHQISQMQGIVLITLATIIVVLLFLFGEILGFFDLRSKYKKELADLAPEKSSTTVPLHMVRLIIFITFLAFNMATSFLPVYAARLVSVNIGIPQKLAASLPVTLNLAFMGIMSLFCAPLTARFRFKNIAIVSAGICFVGDMTIFLNTNYYALIVGLILNGIGVGLITNCINMFIASSEDMTLKRDGFTIFNSGSTSGINIGSMLGASLAGSLSQRQVFAVSSATWILVAVLFLVLGKYIFQAGKMADREAQKRTRTMGIGRFLASPSVWGYMIFVQIPYIMLNSFIYYYVPLYCADMGYSENITCLFLMVNSLCSVFFGGTLTKFFIGKFDRLSIYISTVMSLAALMLFAVSPTVNILIVALVIMGISSSFGISSKSVYFTELPKVKAYGEEESMGVYNLADNAGESVGPMIFGSLMSSENLLIAMGKFVAVIFGSAVVYALGSLRNKKIRDERR